MIANLLLFVGLAVFGGLGSSWYMIEKGSRLTTRSIGPWVIWNSAGRSDADPYTRAHFMRRGMLPVSSALVQSFQATTDSDGQALFASCEYAIEGGEPAAGFWSIAVFDENGQTIANPADRYSFNSATIMRGAASRLNLVLARSARPGNWLPTGGAGRITLMLTIEEPDVQTGMPDDSLPASLPGIRRIACR